MKNMKHYVFDYIAQNKDTKLVGVGAFSKKDAIKKAQEKIGSDCKLIKNSIISYSCINK
jgi:hypothetical protein